MFEKICENDIVIHVGSNDITHRIFEDFNADQLVDEIIDIGKICRQDGLIDVIFFSIFVKNSIKVGKTVSQENETVTKKCDNQSMEAKHLVHC